MKKQYAVFGLGGFGESVAIELQKLGCEVVAIDANMERVEAIANQALKMQTLSVRLERGIWTELW